MGGTLAPEATPGGGLTMTVALPVADTTNTTDVPELDRADPALLDHVQEWSRPHQADRT